jgi:hypothetical protein
VDEVLEKVKEGAQNMMTDSNDISPSTSDGVDVGACNI